MEFRWITLLAMCFGAWTQSPKMEALPIVLPHPLFEGTPEPTNVSNLEKPKGRPRPAFMAPAGVTNVALKKSVTPTDSDPLTGSLEMITDGKKESVDVENNASFGVGKARRYIETAEGKLIDGKGVEARYVRFVSNGSDKTQANHYVEIEVFGKPLK
jgi:hypothetical protein